jgi:hypothetical protein
MKPVKSFEQFRSEIMESKKLNEGILDTVKKTLKKIGDFFSGAGSKFLNALVFQTKGDLPKSVKIYPNQADLAVLKMQGETVKEPALPEAYSTHKEDEAIMEAKIELEHPDPTVVNIDTKKMKFLLETQIRAGQKEREPAPILFWGAPGIGKTAIIEQVSKFHDMSMGNNRLIVVDLATMRPEDFFLPAAKGGVGKDYDPSSKSVRLPVEWLPLYDVKLGEEGNKEANGVDNKGGIIFFDEIARCSAEVQDICLKLCDDSRRVGNFKLGSKWVIICAANRASDETDSDKTFRFSSTLGNRFKQYNFVPKFSDWAEWAGSAKDQDGDMVVTPEILTFLRFFEDFWHNIDPDLTDKYGDKRVIFPTPRSWTKASIELKNQRETAKELGEKFTTQDVKDAVAGSVGKKAADEFAAFLELTSKIDPKDIAKVYTDPDKAPTLKGLNLSEQKGLMAAVLMQKSKEELSDAELTNFIKWVIKLDDEAMAMRIVSQLLDFHPSLKNRELYAVDLRNLLFDQYKNLTKTKQAL